MSSTAPTGLKTTTTPISQFIWESRYRWVRAGVAVDGSIEETWARVAMAVADVEEHSRAEQQTAFLELLKGYRFLPGGRILAGAGTDRNTTLFNCFVMGVIDDDMTAIFNSLKEAALTLQLGGGIGCDFSTLRPRGTAARSTGNVASGPVSYLKVWDTMCDTIMSGNGRRGAMMATLRCDHPDIEAFIDAKRDAGALAHFNLSVLITDAFMKAVEDDDDWPLLFPAASIEGAGCLPTVMRRWPGQPVQVTCAVLGQRPARAIWERLVRSSYETAEPGVLFIDHINAANPMSYREQISCTNPCGEVPLPPYGACNLGSLNLTRFVLDPFEAGARPDLSRIAGTARVATRFLDNVIDCSRFPVTTQQDEAQGSRRIGIGITGLASALIMLGLDYRSQAARDLASLIMGTIHEAACQASIELAREKGAFPYFVHDAFCSTAFFNRLPAPLQEGIRTFGVRNSHLLAIAPTGTISLLAGNVSSGIEPVYDFEVRRRMLDRRGTRHRFQIEDYAHALWNALYAERPVPDYFVRSRDVSPKEQLLMQASLQQHVDNAISKTINVPRDYGFDAFRDVFQTAWRLELKGCTAYRDGVRDDVLSPAPDSCGSAGCVEVIA